MSVNGGHPRCRSLQHPGAQKCTISDLAPNCRGKELLSDKIWCSRTMSLERESCVFPEIKKGNLDKCLPVREPGRCISVNDPANAALLSR